MTIPKDFSDSGKRWYHLTKAKQTQSEKKIKWGKRLLWKQRQSVGDQNYTASLYSLPVESSPLR